MSEPAALALYALVGLVTLGIVCTVAALVAFLSASLEEQYRLSASSRVQRVGRWSMKAVKLLFVMAITALLFLVCVIVGKQVIDLIRGMP